MNIERVQKTACRIILGDSYTDYSSAQEVTGLDSLRDRRTKLSLTFAKKCTKSKLNEDTMAKKQKSSSEEEEEEPTPL